MIKSAHKLNKFFIKKKREKHRGRERIGKDDLPIIYLGDFPGRGAYFPHRMLRRELVFTSISKPSNNAIPISKGSVVYSCVQPYGDPVPPS